MNINKQLIKSKLNKKKLTSSQQERLMFKPTNEKLLINKQVFHQGNIKINPVKHLRIKSMKLCIDRLIKINKQFNLAIQRAVQNATQAQKNEFFNWNNNSMINEERSIS